MIQNAQAANQIMLVVELYKTSNRPLAKEYSNGKVCFVQLLKNL
jgi:hypothetical protein